MDFDTIISEPPASPSHRETLALFGGSPAVVDPELKALQWPVFTEDEKQSVLEMMGRSDPGDYYQEIPIFERKLCDYFKSRYALSVTNGTAALHSALHGIDLCEGDEVITCSYTYWATVVSIRLVGAIPVFVDILASTGGIDPDDIERKITERTRAIMLVHLWGMPCEMDAILKLAEKYNLAIIEDCAHAHGAEYKGKKVGTFGKAGCFSMQASKNMPTVEGGFLLTQDPDVYARACALGHYGRIPQEHSLAPLNTTGLGYKYRIHPFATAIGIHRLRTLDERNAQVEKRMSCLFDAIRGLQGIELFECPPDRTRVFYQAEIKYNEEQTGIKVDHIIKAMTAEGAFIVHERYPLQHKQPIYSLPKLWSRPVMLPDSLPASELLHQCVLQIPTFPACAEKLVDQYIHAFTKVWSNLDQLRSI